MFIQCSDCDYKYIVNSADLKPDGRMVECANCNHRWYQEPLQAEEYLSSSVPHAPKEDHNGKVKNKNTLKVTNEFYDYPNLFEVNNYLEAAGIILAIKKGIYLNSIKRPLKKIQKCF